MAQPKLQQEPSMEEILASIRRIIDSGEETGRSPAPRSAQPRDTAQTRSASDGSAQPEPQSNDDWFSREEAVSNEPVVVSRYHSAEQPSPFEQQSNEIDHSETAASQQEHLSDEQQAYRENGGQRAADNTSRDQATENQSAAEELKRAADQEIEAVYPGTMGEVARQVHEATSQIYGSKPVDAGEPLLSEQSEARISDAFRELSTALEREGARSIEDIVAEELRPLLSSWLETNMPSIVENVVSRELERMRSGKPGKR